MKLKITDYQGRQCDLEARSEAELIEGYNRRDNVRIIGRKMYKSNEESI